MSNQEFNNFLASLILNYPVNDLSNNLISNLTNDDENYDVNHDVNHDENHDVNHDLSNNTYPPSTHTHIFSLLNMINSELPPITQSSQNTLQNLLQSTLRQKNCYKHVLSDEGKTKIKYLKYEAGKYEETKCSILQMPFKDGDEIAQLPCGHIFDKDSIIQWLEEESNKCPVCRYEMESKEEKITSNNVETTSSHPFGPTNRRIGFTNFLNNYYEAQENRLVQRAIEQSLLDLSSENNATETVESDSEVEIPIFVESDSDDSEMDMVD